MSTQQTACIERPQCASALQVPQRLWQNEPLWKRAPSRDDEGRLLGDFMMLIPRLASAQVLRRERVYVELQAVFRHYSHLVRFADLNLRLNLLWISVDPAPGSIREVARAIRGRIPEAVLVGHECGWADEPVRDRGSVLRRFAWRRAVLALAGLRNRKRVGPGISG